METLDWLIKPLSTHVAREFWSIFGDNRPIRSIKCLIESEWKKL